MQTDYRYLTRVAVDTIWCSPEQDKQYMFRPQKISGKQGAVNRVYMFDEYFGLPTKSIRYHVYQVLAAPISRFNLDLKTNTWTRCDTVSSIHNMIISVYTENGIMRPLEDCWLMHTDSKAIVLAVAVNRQVEFDTSDAYLSDDLFNQPVFIRFYTNFFFSLPESAWTNREVEVFGRLLKLESDVLAMNQFYNSKVAEPGGMFGQVNGISFPFITPADYTVGDYVEIIYDSSISERLIVPLSTAVAFESEMDNVNKYLIRPATTSNYIRFYDDMDFYLTKEVNTRHRGAYLHRNAVSNIRMVTHDTYSMSDPYLQSVIAGYTPALTTDIRSLYVIIVIRNAMNFRDLVDVSNRVGEMYRVSQLLNTPIVFNDPNIALQEWKLSKLESSYYNAAMRLPYQQLTNEPVARAFGYHSIAKRIGKSMHARNGATVSLPVGVRNACTIFEYDINGRLIDYYTHTTGNDHAIANGSCAKLEIVSGIATTNGEFKQALGNYIIEAGVGYRLYRENGQLIEDVTRLTNIYTIATQPNGDRVVSWLAGGNYFVVNDKYFPLIDTMVASGEPVIQVAFQAPNNVPFKAPLSDIDVWLNGYPLVENIDYIVKYPSVVICCAKRFNPLGQANRVIVRGRGLRAGNSYRSTNQTGFIEYGLLSNNEVEEFHGDQNLRIIVDGGIRVMEEVTYNAGGSNSYFTNTLYYAEDANLSVPTVTGPGGVVTLGYNQNHPLNGTPYSIRDNYVGLGQWVSIDPIELRETAIDFDRRMNAFVTANRTLPQPVINNNILIPYRLFSPTVAGLIKDLLADQIPHQVYRKPVLDREEVQSTLAPWLGYISQDPAEELNYKRMGGSVARIHAHPYQTAVEIDTFSWRLIEFVSENFFGGRVDVSLDIVINDTPNPTQW